MTDILKEVRLEKEYTRIVELYKKSLPYVVGATLVVILALVAYNWNQERIFREAEERTSLIIDALFAPLDKQENAKDILLSLIEKNDGVSDLAYMEIIANLKKAGRIDEANLKAEHLIANANSEITKNICKLALISELLDKKLLSDADALKLQNYISSVKLGQPLHHIFEFMHALYYIKINNIKSSSDILRRLLLDPNVTEEFKAQINIILVQTNS
ncbi:MAG: DUF2659 family protein [Rickettsiaceae bacterium]|nr:DUF2659 family protein [Rickettsiaceae bacterium]